jgi:DNA-binding NarL/FixJ family response regulator
MTAGINILIVDDEKLFRLGVISMLKPKGINIVGEAENGEEALSLIKSKRPNVVLLDLEMPKLNGSKTLNKIRKDHPEEKVIILSKYHDEELIKDIFNRGAKGFISKKSCEIDILVEAIKRVHAYGIYKDNVPVLLANPAQKDGHYYKLILSRRETEILYWLCQGKSYRDISAQLFIAVNTVDNHTKSIFKKMNVRNREGLVMLASKYGLKYIGGH